MHGLSGPHCFCLPLIRHLLSREKISGSEYVPDYELKVKLEQVAACETQDQLDTLVESIEERFEAGYNKVKILLQDREDFIEKVSWHWTVVRQLREQQSFEDGLASNGVLDMLKRYKDDAESEFVYKAGHLTASMLRNLFQSKFSEEGSAKRSKESDIIFNWCNFLDEAERGLVTEINKLDFGVDESQSNKRLLIQLEDVLFFATGSKFIPPLSMGRGTIDFMHDCDSFGRRVQVSTCSLRLTFPVTNRYTSDSFSNNIIEDIVESPGFGQV